MPISELNCSVYPELYKLFCSCGPRAGFVYLYLDYFYATVCMPFIMPMSAFSLLFTFLEGCILSEAHIRAHVFIQQIFVESLLCAKRC